MRRLRRQLDKLGDALAAGAAPTASRLAPGLTGAEIDAITGGLPFPLPGEVRELYGWRNGLAGEAGPGGELLPGGAWLGLRDAVAERAERRRVAEEIGAEHGIDADVLWPPAWLPLLHDGNGGLHVVDCADRRAGAVLAVSPDDVDSARAAFDGVDALARTLEAAWRTGALAVGEEGVEADAVRYRAIWERANPVTAALLAPPSGLVAELSSPDAHTRSTAARELADRPGARGAVEALVAALDDPVADVRAAAAGTLGALKAKAAAGRLVAALGDPAPGVRSSATFAVGALRHAPASDALTGLLKDADAVVRDGAARALYAIGPPAAAVESLVEMLSDSYADARMDAAAALGRAPGERARAVVESLLDHADPQLRVIAEQALRKRPRG